MSEKLILQKDRLNRWQREGTPISRSRFAEELADLLREAAALAETAQAMQAWWESGKMVGNIPSSARERLSRRFRGMNVHARTVKSNLTEMYAEVEFGEYIIGEGE